MTDQEKFYEAVRSVLRIEGRVYTCLSDLRADKEYRAQIVAAADEGKPIPRKLTALERAAFRAKARDYIKQFRAWAANPSKAPVPKWRG